MKKRVAVLGIVAVVTMIFVAVVGVMPVWGTSEDRAREVCAEMQGTWSSRGSAGAACNGVKAQYSSTCSSYEGTYNGSQCVWTKFSSSSQSKKTDTTDKDDSKDEKTDKSSDSDGTGVSGNPTDGDYGNAMQTGSTECGDGASTSIIGGGGCYNENDSGGGVFTILGVFLAILTWGVGIAGTFGIVLSGIQFMTAKDDPTQVTKAKNRIIQIVIGMAAYAVLWAVLQWILPGGVFGN